MTHDPSASVEVGAELDLTARRAVSFPIARHGYEPRLVDEVLAELAREVDERRAQVAELREREADLLAALDAADERTAAAERRADDAVAELVTATRAAATAEPEPVDATTHGAGPHDAVGSEAPDVAAVVGAETIRIIEAAQQAAVEIGVRARDDAERTAEAAREDARQIRADAEIQLLHKTREADDAVAARLLEAADAVQQAQERADAIIADAFSEAAEVVLRARQEAEATATAGEARGRELVEAAVAARDELLADLVQRRKALRRQVEQLEAGRARLRAAYDVVEAAMVDATGELDRTLDEARDAARAAAEASDAGADPELEAALAALGSDLAPTGVAPAVEAPAEPVVDEEPTEPGAAPPAEPADAIEVAADESAGTVEADPVADPDIVEHEAPADEPGDEEPEPASASAAPSAEAAEPRDDLEAGGDPVAADPVDADPLEPGVVDADPALAAEAPAPGDADAQESEVVPTEVEDAPAAAPTSRRRRRRAPDPVEFEGRWSSAVRVLAPGAEPADSEAVRVEPVGRRSRSGASASDVFARLRAADPAQPSLFDDPAAVAPDADDDPELVWLARRDAALAPSVRALRRRLKATLADDEDDLLEGLRRGPEVPEHLEALRDGDARRADLAVALAPSLAAAADAGAGLASVDAGAVPARATEVDLDDVAADLVDALLAPLEERLDRSLARYHKVVAEAGASGGPDDAADAAMASLVTSVKAAYRARRGVQVTIPTEDAVLRAAHLGLLAALEPGTPLRWVVAAPATPPARRAKGAAADTEAAEPPPTPRDCPSCVAVADVGAGDRFGHGYDLPPVRPGCRCAVAPVSAVVPRRV